jgi:hypothetical protein
MKLVFGPLRADRPALESRWDVLLGVVADLSIVVEERRLLHEEMFPIVELAASFRRWLDDLDRGSVRDFSYESMESAEGPLIQFLRQDAGWRVRSPLQEFEEIRSFTTDEVRDAALQFVEDVQRAAAVQLNLEVGRWITA